MWFNVRLTCVLVLAVHVHSYSDCINQHCEECRFFFKKGDKCSHPGTHPLLYCDPNTDVIKQTATSFLECNNSILELRECPLGSYYEDGKGCVDPTSAPLMQGLAVSGSGRVGDACQFNTDCLGGMYCSGGVCTCLSTFIMREYYCYEKVNPNQPGCTYDIQCESVWPGAKCRMDSSVGTCRCPEETHVARETRDGWVCVSLTDHSTGATVPLYFVCPLPEGAGFKIALNDPTESGSLPVGCTVGSSATIEPVIGLHGGGACTWPSDGEYIGDIYDCLHTSPHVNLASKFPLSSYAPTADGVCCPSRALACIQPQVTGPNPTEPRWWYNSVTGTCQQFMWDPAASEARYHSANNFRTIQHCESYCRDTCQRGSPQYSGDQGLSGQRPLTSCSTITSCSSDYQCSAIGSQHLCCPTPGSVCSARGGRPFDLVPRPTIYHAGFLVSTGKEAIRFYYDTNTGRCQDFVYRGAGGNFNNFLSRHECELYCSRLQCERGTPLRVGEEAQRCQHNGHCPSSYECRVDQGVCCPRKQTICAQPLRVGDCTESVKRYWYNAKARQCQMFEYTGCQGNDNNFETVLDCQSFCKNAIPEPKCIQGQAYRNPFGDFVTCNTGAGCPSNYECYYDGEQWGCCPSKAFTCSLNADPGIQCGSGSTFKFFYNTQTQNCESFQYNGCDGNSNNFANREMCEQYCSVGGCPYGGTPLRDHSGMAATCSTQENCPSSHECGPVIVGGSTINRCCPTRSYMCGLPPQQGTQCGANFVTRYYFNIVTGQCTPFQFGGCDGNYNNFLTSQQCRSFCYSSSCPAGNVVYVDPNSQMPIQCNEALSNSCPSGYTCTFNALINGHVCCGATDNGVCPEGEKAFVSTADMSPRECVVNMDASCPANYLCRFNMQKNKYFCCASASGRTCPIGKFLHRDSFSLIPTRCTMGRAEQCPDGYTCQNYLPNSAQGFCCTNSSVCPDDAEFVVDEQSQLPRACTMGSFVNCPHGYACRSLTSAVEGFCCRTGSTTKTPSTDGCPPGNYVFMKGDEVAVCDPFNPPNAPCADGFTCQWSLANQKYQCCGSNPAPPPLPTNDGCPNAQLAYRDRGTVQICTAGSSTCPPGYFCQFSASNRQFQCCGVNGGCPAESVAFVGLSGEPQQCVLGQSKCPIGFACRRSVAGHHICCTKKKKEACSDKEMLIDGVCLRTAAPGAACLKSEQCLGGSLCQSGICECPPSTVPIGGFCQEEIKCGPEQVKHGALCHNKVELGKPCVIKEQCPSRSSCIKDVCACEAPLTELLGKCVSISARSKIEKSKGGSSKCANSNSKPLLSDETGRVVFCSPKTKLCPSGYTCQLNSRKTQYMCCTDDPQLNDDVCPTGRIPYLLNGLPQKCTSQRCPKGYDCTYRDQDYICCSSAGKPARRVSTSTPDVLTANDQCPRGGALIYPSTRMPVICVPGKKGCPPGYACKKSITSDQFVCCSSRFRLSAFPGPPCEGYLVVVSRVINGRIEERCERSCPYMQVPIGGICYEMRRN